MSAMDKDLAATLTPEELEAINSTEDIPGEDVESLKALAAGAEDDDDEDDSPNESAPPVEGAAPAQEAPPQEPPKAEEAPAQKAEAFKYKAELPANFEETLADLSEREADLKQKFRDGDIEFDEFEESRAAIIAEREKLNTARIKAEISQEMTQQTAAQQWQNTVNSFLSDVSKEVDYKNDADKAADLDQFVKVLANNPKNSDKPMDWFLSEAHKRVKALYDIGAPQATPPVDTKQNRKPPLDAAPKTLAQVPGGDGPGDVSGEFAHLDALEGDDLEMAIAKMTPAQREKFARS